MESDSVPTRLLPFCFAVVCVTLLTGADWRQFRGNRADGINDSANPPVNLDRIAWQSELDGRGLSGPIVVGKQVFITSSSGFNQDRLHIVCFDADDGEKLWERQFWATGRTMCHPKMCMATPSPASDGERIFAYFSTNDVVCLDLDGNLLWLRGLMKDYPNASNSLGMASSPIVVGETLIVQLENDTDSFALGLDVESGMNVWKIERPRRANWTSPTVLEDSQRGYELVLLQSSAGLSAVHPQDGRVVWSYDDGASTIPSSVASRNAVYVPSHGLTALRPIAASESPEIHWQQSRLSPATASLLVYGDLVYSLNSAGVLSAAAVDNGELAWRLRLKGPFSSSPVGGGGHLYFFNEQGLGQVVRPEQKQGTIVSTRDLTEPILGTPAIAGDALFVRSDRHLWKFAD